MSHKKILASKLDILEFIMRRKIIFPYELVEKFHYSERPFSRTLYRLKKEGLVINMTRGSWELTEEGFKRLKYYGKSKAFSGISPASPPIHGLRREKMRGKEVIIRYLALVDRADRHQIANPIVASPNSVSFKLTQLKHSGLITNIKWSDGNKVWVLTPEGYWRHDYYQLQDKNKKYKQRQKRSNVPVAFNYLKANLSQAP